MKVWLAMLVERDAEGRFDGEIFQLGRGTLVGFSGTPQMLKVLQDMVPPRRPVHGNAEPAGVGSAAAPAGR